MLSLALLALPEQKGATGVVLQRLLAMKSMDDGMK